MTGSNKDRSEACRFFFLSQLPGGVADRRLTRAKKSRKGYRGDKGQESRSEELHQRGVVSNEK